MSSARAGVVVSNNVLYYQPDYMYYIAPVSITTETHDCGRMLIMLTVNGL